MYIPFFMHIVKGVRRVEKLVRGLITRYNRNTNMPHEHASQPHHEKPQNPFAGPETALKRSDVRKPAAELREQPLISFGSATEASRNHPDRNEDELFTDAARGIGGVFDGVGGVPAGDLASRAAARELEDRALDAAVRNAINTDEAIYATEVARVFESPADAELTEQDVERAMDAMLRRMNDATLREAQTNPQVRMRAIQVFIKRYKKIDSKSPADLKRLKHIQESLACTASIFKTWNDANGGSHLTVGQVGDSRIYRLRGQELERLTRDDSYVETLIDYGLVKDDQDVDQKIDVEALKGFAVVDPECAELVKVIEELGLKRPSLGHIRNLMTKSIGMEHPGGSLKLVPQVRTYDLREGDVVLVVSDGISDNLRDDEIQAILQKHREDPIAACDELVRMAQVRAQTISHARAKADDMTAVILRRGTRH